MKLAVNFSEALLNLFADDPALPVDYVKVPTIPFPDCFSQFDQGRVYRKLLPHPAQPGVISLGHPSPKEQFNRELIAKIIDLTNPPYLSTHLEASLDFFPEYKKEKYHFDPELKKALLNRFLTGINLVKKATGLPVVLENFPYYSWWRHYKLGSDPSFISEVCEIGDCDFLLDIAHARCSAWYFGVPIERYLESLPLSRMVEIHLAGTILRTEGVRDAHTKLSDDDYQLLEFILKRTVPKIVTIEYGGMPDQIMNLKHEFEPLYRNDRLELKEMIYRVLDVLSVDLG